MKKVSYCLLGLMLSSALLLSASFSSVAVADGHDVGAALYKASCASCHKSKFAGRPEEGLLKKFAFYEEGDFTSGAKKKMKDLFMAMSAEEKASLAKYINGMK